jgi:hypothetical protein
MRSRDMATSAVDIERPRQSTIRRWARMAQVPKLSPSLPLPNRECCRLDQLATDEDGIPWVLTGLESFRQRDLGHDWGSLGINEVEVKD